MEQHPTISDSDETESQEATGHNRKHYILPWCTGVSLLSETDRDSESESSIDMHSDRGPVPGKWCRTP